MDFLAFWRFLRYFCKLNLIFNNPFQTSDTMSVGSGEYYIPPNDDEMEEEDDDDDEDQCPEAKTRNFQQYRQLVEAAKRFNISVRALWHIINSIMVDLKITDKKAYISYEKVRKMMKKYGDELEHAHDQIIKYQHIGYDGKKSQTLEARSQSKVMDKETVVCQSRWCYVDHFIPEDGKGITLGVELHNVSIKCYFTHTLFCLHMAFLLLSGLGKISILRIHLVN